MDLFCAYHPSNLLPSRTTGRHHLSSTFARTDWEIYYSDVERALFSLPVRLGGLGICDPKSHSDAEFDSSVKITSALVALIVQQELTFSIDTLEAQRSAKCEVVRMKHRAHDEVAATLCQSLPVGLQRIVTLSSEKGASSWLSALPVEEHGFALHKGVFRDALCLCYGWLPSDLPTQCVCGQGFSVDHSMNCPTGGYPTLRHNELRDFTAAILSEVCTDVCVEPPLQSLSGETLTYATANREDGARNGGSRMGHLGQMPPPSRNCIQDRDTLIEQSITLIKQSQCS